MISVIIPGSISMIPAIKSTTLCHPLRLLKKYPVKEALTAVMPIIEVMIDKIICQKEPPRSNNCGARTNIYGTIKAPIDNLVAVTPVLKGSALAIAAPA